MLVCPNRGVPSVFWWFDHDGPWQLNPRKTLDSEWNPRRIPGSWHRLIPCEIIFSYRRISTDPTFSSCFCWKTKGNLLTQWGTVLQAGGWDANGLKTRIFGATEVTRQVAKLFSFGVTSAWTMEGLKRISKVYIEVFERNQKAFLLVDLGLDSSSLLMKDARGLNIYV